MGRPKSSEKRVRVVTYLTPKAAAALAVRKGAKSTSATASEILEAALFADYQNSEKPEFADYKNSRKAKFTDYQNRGKKQHGSPEKR